MVDICHAPWKNSRQGPTQDNVTEKRELADTMELSVREWMIIIGVLLVVAVLLDGYRRMRLEQQSNLRISLKDGEREDDLHNPELPGGGARVVAVRDAPAPKQPKRTLPSDETPVAMDTELDEDAWPEELDSDDGQEDRPEPYQSDLIPESLSRPVDDIERTSDQSNDVRADAPQDFEPEPLIASRDDAIVPDAIEPEVEQESTHERNGEAPGRFERLKQAMSGSEPRNKTKGKSAADQGPTELIVLNVVAPQGTVFGGEDLLQILLACDVRLGKMNIFHRYEEAGGKGPEQFSVVNLVEPGTFDLDNLAEFSSPGVGFFMHLPGPSKPLEAFAAMAETAKVLSKNLGGELRDEQHSAATTQTIEHYRQRILDFERRQLTLV